MFPHQPIYPDVTDNGTTIEDIIKVISEVLTPNSGYKPYTVNEKDCIYWDPNMVLHHDSSNCSIDEIEFWNRVVPNVDVDYECEAAESPEVRPSVLTKAGTTLIGRRITEFGRPGLDTYFGVPYAQAPIGTKRFQRPVAPGHEDVVDCALQQPECVRTSQDLEYASEDCLYLDIWTPVADLVEEEAKWTMVYFCDGHISLSGVAQQERPQTKCRNWMGYFTEDYDVISVHVNYRHGIFGFGTDLGESIPTNNGFYDQRLALEWIFENVGLFGGSADRIVFVGQGFGGVAALLHGRDLHPARIISSSGTLNMKFPFTTEAETVSNNIKRKLNCQSTLLDCLQSKSTGNVLYISF